MTAQMLPCPFCGSTNVDPEGWMSVNADGTQKKSGPACDDCGGSTDTVERWNNRCSAGSDGPIGYISAITLKALSERAEGHGFVVACAGYDTTIPVYAHPAPPAAASVREALEAAIQRHASAYVARGAALSDDIIAECRASREALLAALSELAPAAPTREEIIEECAREADRLHEDPAWSPGYKNASAAIARKIRRLKSAPQSQAETAK